MEWWDWKEKMTEGQRMGRLRRTEGGDQGNPCMFVRMEKEEPERIHEGRSVRESERKKGKCG